MDASAQDTSSSMRGSEAPPGVAAIVESWAQAWNRHDMQAAGALMDAAVDFVTVAGVWLHGRDDFLRHHLDIHRRHMRETTWTTDGWSVRALRSDVVVAHLEWTITGERGPDGSAWAPRSGVFTWILAFTQGAWRIVVAHNTNLRADTSRRRAAGGTA